MPEERHWYLAMYDIREDERLRRVHDILSGWGKPLQYSVFYARLTRREVERVKFELAEVVEEEDRLAFVRLCQNCASRVHVQGEEMSPMERDPPPFYIA